MRKIHNQLRSRFEWYHRWHNFDYHTHIHFLIFSIFSFFIILLVFSQIFPLFFSPDKLDNYQIFAQSDSKTLTSQADWQAGSYDIGLDTENSPGAIKLFSEKEIQPTVGTITTNGTGNIPELHDGVTASGGISLDAGEYILWDFGQTISNVTRYRIYRILGSDGSVSSKQCAKPIGEGVFSCGDIDGDGVNWINYSVFGNGNLERDKWTERDVVDSDKSKFRLENDQVPAETYTISEFEAYFSPLTAFHTSQFGQIGAITQDPGRYVVNWETFTPTESEPANSKITYRFRKTNADGSWTGAWTDYIDYTGSAINLNSYSELNISQDDIDNNRTYLQVETKFERDAGTTNTPVVNEYTVQYHTNKPPNAPTPQ